jgi:ribosomal protein L44E
MAIPIIATPTYELMLPSSKKKIKYRPFLVKEEKLLLLAMETKDPAHIQETTKQIVKDCTFGEVDVELAPPFDVEYILLQLRIRSVGEKSTLKIRCSSCETPKSVEVDLTKVEVVKKEGHTNDIRLTDTMGVLLRYPTMVDSSNIGLSENDKEDKAKNAEQSIAMIASCIDVIYDGEKVYKTKEFTKQEVIEFIENLSQGMFQKIATFFEEMPALRHEIKFNCDKCKTDNTLMVRGIQDFFT